MFVFSVLILSCSKEKEHYSCDAELDYNYSRPAYIALKPISKFKIWEVKLNDVQTSRIKQLSVLAQDYAKHL